MLSIRWRKKIDDIIPTISTKPHIVSGYHNFALEAKTINAGATSNLIVDISSLPDDAIIYNVIPNLGVGWAAILIHTSTLVLTGTLYYGVYNHTDDEYNVLSSYFLSVYYFTIE